ncbi:trypsin-like peptidase domain-containing protein [Antarctobacter sp.]|uniref:trypsin-like serine peptidase n=1 Tax=Antarctobacter sp. TaxID=1872577 RepID=UPI003A95794F
MSFKKSLCAALLIASPALSQDLIGFDLSSFGKTVLSNTQAAGGDVMLEAAFGAYNNEFIATYSPKSVFAKMGRAVGRLDVATDAGVFPCTAFLVADDLLMTNHHCVPGILDHERAGATAIVGVQFVAGYLLEGIEEGSERFLVNPVPVETSKTLDYTLLRILGSKPGRQYGTLALAGVDPDDNAPFWIIGHPMGEAQRISREKCRANAPALSKDRVLHTCDTLPGNSGSPVIDAGTQQVIALHHAGSARNSINYAVPMTAILRNSTVLKSATPIVAPAPAKPDRDTQADRALARLFGLQDDTALAAGLNRLIADFPGTPAARSAQARLDGLQRSQQAASDRAQQAKANEALLAALVLTDADAQRRALEAMLRTYGDTPAAAAARATLATLQRPKTAVPVVQTKPVAQPKPVTKTPDTARFPEGTVLKIPSLAVRNGPRASATTISTVFGQVTLGTYVGEGWYRVAGSSGRFVLVPEEAKPFPKTAPTPAVTAKTSDALPPPSKTTTAAMIETTTIAARRYAPGSVLKSYGHSIYDTPSTKARVVNRSTGSTVLGEHVFENWYKVQGRTKEYVQVRSGLKILVSATADAATPPSKAATAPMIETTTIAARRYAPGSVLMAYGHSIYDSPSTKARVVNRSTGSTVLGEHVFENWYKVQGRTKEYVQVRSGLKILVSAKTEPPSRPKTVTARTYTPGTVVQIGSRPVRNKPISYEPAVSTVHDRVKIGSHVMGDWYTIFGDSKKFVHLPPGLTILSGGN